MSIRYETISNQKIPSSRKIRPKKIHSNYEINSRLKTTISSISSNIYQGNTSTILTEYEQSLKNDIQINKLKQLQRKERNQHKTIQSLIKNQRESRVQSNKLMSELESIKYRLKTISLERQSDFSRKQRSILLKNSMEEQKQNYPLLPNLSAPLHYPYLFTNPPHPNYNLLTNSSVIQENYQSNASHPKITYQKKNRSTTSSQNYHKEIKNEQTKQTVKKNSKIVTKTQFNNNQFKKRIKDFNRFQNKQSNVRKLRKCFLAVYFAFVLKKSYLKIVNQRRKFFLQFWPEEFFKFQQSFKEYFYSKFLPFFQLLKEKQYTSLIPSQQDTKSLQLQKKKTLRQLIKLFFQCLRPLKNVQNLGKIAWGFCSNGSFADKGVLTTNQIEFVSFNETLGYLRMDSSLQKSQIISFIFIKIVLFKFLLHPWKKWLKLFNPSENKLLIQNLKLISSIIYDLFITLQDEYMSSSDLRIYPLGNYHEVKRKNVEFFIQFSQPLMYETKKIENQLISGLYSQQFLKKKIGFKKILPYLQNFKQVVEGIYSQSKKYDNIFRSKVLKFVPKVNYKY